ncbi:MAG TPA: hypothetical protein VIJ55_13755, partial [Acetobacteraceae bacterium]
RRGTHTIFRMTARHTPTRIGHRVALPKRQHPSQARRAGQCVVAAPLTFKAASCAAIFLASNVSFAAPPAASQSPLPNIDVQRQASIAEFKDEGVPKPDRIREEAKRLFALPTDQQSDDDLRTLAKASNAYANYVDLIHRGYQDAQRENYQYDFVVKVLNPIADDYTRIENEFKDYRNKAYLNLAEKSEVRGDMLQALFLYNDAFRLSSFDCSSRSPTNETCTRWAAEKAMQRILGISGFEPYTTWQK